MGRGEARHKAAKSSAAACSAATCAAGGDAFSSTASEAESGRLAACFACCSTARPASPAPSTCPRARQAPRPVQNGAGGPWHSALFLTVPAAARPCQPAAPRRPAGFPALRPRRAHGQTPVHSLRAGGTAGLWKSALLPAQPPAVGHKGTAPAPPAAHRAPALPCRCAAQGPATLWRWQTRRPAVQRAGWKTSAVPPPRRPEARRVPRPGAPAPAAAKRFSASK